MENKQIDTLNEFYSQQILNVLYPLKNNLSDSVELIEKTNSPTLTSSIVSFLNNLSVDTVYALVNLIINPDLGVINKNSIILYKYFSFNSSYSGKFRPIFDTTEPKDNIKRIEYQILYLDEFIEIKHNLGCDYKFELKPHTYTIFDNSVDVLENLQIIINIIERVISNYE